MTKVYVSLTHFTIKIFILVKKGMRFMLLVMIAFDLMIRFLRLALLREN